MRGRRSSQQTLSMTEVNPSLYPVINKEDSIEFAVQVLKRNPLVYMNLPMPQKEKLEIIGVLTELLCLSLLMAVEAMETWRLPLSAVTIKIRLNVAKIRILLVMTIILLYSNTTQLL
jgi:hypothetical protein